MLSSHGEVESFGNGIHSNAQAVPLPFLHEYSKHDSYAYSNSNHSILGSQGGALAVPRPLIGSALAVPRYSLNSVLGSPGIPKVSVGNLGSSEFGTIPPISTSGRLPTCCDPPQEQPSDASQIHIHDHVCNSQRSSYFNTVHGDPISQRIFGIDIPQDIILDEKLPNCGENTYMYEREIPYRGCHDQQMVTSWQLFHNFQVSQESNPVTHNYDNNNDFHSYVHNHRIRVPKQI